MRLRTHHAHITAEATAIEKSTRRAMHELGMAAIDLRLAERKREAAVRQVELARAGVLGIDYVPPTAAPTNAL